MVSLFDELSGRLREDPRVSRRGGPRADLGLLLFGGKDALNSLWKTADQFIESGNSAALEGMRMAVEHLRPIFGERTLP